MRSESDDCVVETTPEVRLLEPLVHLGHAFALKLGDEHSDKDTGGRALSAKATVQAFSGQGGDVFVRDRIGDGEGKFQQFMEEYAQNLVTLPLVGEKRPCLSHDSYGQCRCDRTDDSRCRRQNLMEELGVRGPRSHPLRILSLNPHLRKIPKGVTRLHAAARAGRGKLENAPMLPRYGVDSPTLDSDPRSRVRASAGPPAPTARANGPSFRTAWIMRAPSWGNGTP